MLSHRSFAFLFLGLIPVFGQEPAENETPAVVTPPAVKAPGVPPINRRPQLPPGVPIPGALPGAAAGAPAVNELPRQPGVPPGQTKIIGDINEPKLSGNALAGLYRKYTGRRVIVSAAASTAEFSFVQEATPQDPLTYDEAAELLRKAAVLENFVFVPDGQNPNLDILTLSTSGTRPTAIGVAVYNENDTLPEGDAVISYVMTLSYIKPAEAVNTFTQIIGQFGAYGSIAAVANASAVVITENTSLIRKLIDLKKEIDKPGSVQGTRFIKVQYADVTEIATTLTDLLTAQQATQKTAGIQRAEGGAPPVGGGGQVVGQHGGANVGNSGEESPVQIIPDPRTNRIFAMGRPVDLLFVEGLIREFDVETSEKNFLRRKLRFLTVSDFLPVASDALTRAFSSGASSGSGGAGAQGSAAGGAKNGRSQSSGRQSSAGGRSSGSTGANFGGSSSSGSSALGGSSGSSGGGMGGGSSSGSSSAGTSLSEPNASSAPESVLVGRTLLVADNITNSIVVQGPPSGLEIIERLLDQIDVKPDQVMISTVIGQLTLDDSHKFGMDYLALGGDVLGGAGGGLRKLLSNPAVGTPGTPGTPGFVPATTGAFDPSSLSQTGLRVYGKIGNNLSVYLEALQSKSDFTVLSRPSIFTSNNQKGTISSGEKIAIPTGSNSFGTSGNASTQIQYQDVVLKLEVIPLVNSDNEITMQIALADDEQNGTQTIAGGGGNGGDLTVPKISTRQILTTVTVPNNETIVLGGLIITRAGKDKSGIPILSSIPYIGGLFGTTSDTKNRSELLVFMQPSVVQNDRSLHAVQADIDDRYKVSGLTRGMGDGPGVLPPAGAIRPVADKGGSVLTVNKTTVSGNQPPPIISTMKPSIQPANRK